MRIILIILIGLFIAKPFSGFSQKDSSGIYFTVNDYLNHKLAFVINCKNQKHKIKADMIFHQKEISIKHNDSTYNYPNPFINTGESILIYKVETGSGMKNNPVVINYYFSKDAASEIQKLTINNLKMAFQNNHKFHDLIDMEFHSDNELIKYDAFHKMTRINKIYLNSLIGKEK
ncbi:MAG: hypothetical protein L6Q66_14325 [Bacteroidia bacterium]|nr:hypothetical protein [Bacteroidia bacterium]